MKNIKLKKAAFVALALIDTLFLVISVLKWDMMLSVCCFVLAILLTYLYEDVGFGEFYYGKKMRKEYRDAKRKKKKEI
ncbi:MAG: hypothetical protein PHD70_04655 [Anaerostipes sp.]|jgi:predicted histidine transporter YuiF (NhaC family)|nr:hypothetical protein [Anaerostipes sp.]